MARKKTENTEESNQGTLSTIEVDSSPQNENSIALSEGDSFAVGDRVWLKETATIYDTTERLPEYLYHSLLYIRKLKGDMATIQIYDELGMAGAVSVWELIKDV